MDVLRDLSAYTSAPVTPLGLPRGFGLTLLVAVHNWLVLMWQALKVGSARKRFEVRYPTLYEAKADSEFNRVQRAHQNSLEWNTAFLFFLAMGSITCPVSCATAGLLYNQGRVAYARGYYGGSPHQGLWGLYGLFWLLGATGYTAISLLTA